jgi:hypothetical protein
MSLQQVSIGEAESGTIHLHNVLRNLIVKVKHIRMSKNVEESSFLLYFKPIRHFSRIHLREGGNGKRKKEPTDGTQRTPFAFFIGTNIRDNTLRYRLLIYKATKL